MGKYKLEIINNLIGRFYLLVLSEYKRKHWWGGKDWNFIYDHKIGHNYMCPDIYNGKTTVEQEFNNEVELILNQYEGIIEVHRTTITTK